MFDNEIFLYICIVLCALGGAFVKWINENKRFPNTFASMNIEACTALFIGVGCCCVHNIVSTMFAYPPGFACLLSLFGGWYGAVSIDWFGRQFARRFGANEENKPEMDENSEAFQTHLSIFMKKNHVKMSPSDSAVIKPDLPADRPILEKPAEQNDEDSTSHD